MSKPQELKDYEQVTEHQTKHCAQIQVLFAAVEELGLALSILSRTLLRKGVISEADIAVEALDMEHQIKNREQETN